MGYRQNTYMQSHVTCYIFNDVNIVESFPVVFSLDILGTVWMYGQGSEVYLSTFFSIYSCKPKGWRSWWPCGLRGRSRASRLLWIRFRNSLRAGMFVIVVYCVGRERPPRRADHVFWGVLSGVCVCVCRIVCNTETSTICVLQRLIAWAIEWPLNCDDIHVKRTVFSRCSINQFTRFLITYDAQINTCF
jgi:hypothetical protein